MSFKKTACIFCICRVKTEISAFPAAILVMGLSPVRRIFAAVKFKSGYGLHFFRYGRIIRHGRQSP